MRWKFDILELIIAVIIGFILGCAVGAFSFLSNSASGAGLPLPAPILSVPDLPTKSFSSPSSEAKSARVRDLADLNAGEANISYPLRNQHSLSGQLIKKAAERNGCYGDDYLILLAIRKAENGGPGKEFGVKGKAWGTDLETQAAWAAATIVRTRERWERAGRPTDFINFLARRYCPLNSKTWERNVRFWYRRYKNEQIRARG